MTAETELLKKGALVAQNPTAYESLDLTEDEKAALRIEVTKKWNHPWKLYMTVIVCSIGAAVQGWDQTGNATLFTHPSPTNHFIGTNGANLSFPVVYGLSDPETGEPYTDGDFWIIGLVNSAPYLGSAFCGCWLSDPFNNYFGRRGTIFASALVLIATPIGGAFCNTWEDLFATRIIMGVGMGLKGATTPIFVSGSVHILNF